MGIFTPWNVLSSFIHPNIHPHCRRSITPPTLARNYNSCPCIMLLSLQNIITPFHCYGNSNPSPHCHHHLTIRISLGRQSVSPKKYCPLKNVLSWNDAITELNYLLQRKELLKIYLHSWAFASTCNNFCIRQRDDVIPGSRVQSISFCTLLASPTFVSIWKIQDWKLKHKMIIIINKRKATTTPPLECYADYM